MAIQIVGMNKTHRAVRYNPAVAFFDHIHLQMGWTFRWRNFPAEYRGNAFVSIFVRGSSLMFKPEYQG